MTDQYILDKIIDSLEGTCDDLDTACETHNVDRDELTQADLEYIDSKIFECSQCNWWYEVGGQDEDNVCESCQQENEDDNNDS